MNKPEAMMKKLYDYNDCRDYINEKYNCDIDKIPNIDPESSIGTDRETAAQEYGAYPSTRSYGFSIRASF